MYPQVLIRIHLHTFENDLSDIKILVENINGIILKNQEKMPKAEKDRKKQQTFSAKSRRGCRSNSDIAISLSCPYFITFF